MTRILIAFMTLFLVCQSVNADYFCGFTQVDAQPHLGRLAIHTGVVRTAKYVDWMCDNREVLSEEGIFPDADPGTKMEVKHAWMIDGQKIEVFLSSDHSPGRMGAGSAVPDNYLQVTIDGVLLYDATFGNIRNSAEVISVDILAASHLIAIQAVREEYGSTYRNAHSLHFFYGERFGTDGFVCNSEWLWKQFPQKAEAEAKEKRQLFICGTYLMNRMLDDPLPPKILRCPPGSPSGGWVIPVQPEGWEKPNIPSE